MASVLVQCRLLPFLVIVRYACMNILKVFQRRKARLRLPGYDLEICDKVSANAADSICVQQCSPLCDNLNSTTDQTLDDAKKLHWYTMPREYGRKGQRKKCSTVK